MCTGEVTLRPIADVRSGFSSRFGIPRQSGLAPSAEAEIIFRKAYRHQNYVRGLEDFSHIWVLWGFNGCAEKSPTVRPPRLGGNRRVGVFATRSPYRPNPIAMSCVRLIGVAAEDGQLTLRIAGADMKNGTAVYDIKPYVLADCHPEADMSFAGQPDNRLSVLDPDGALAALPDDLRAVASELLALDPRPAYHTDPERVYAMEYGGFEVHFTVSDGTVTVRDVLP